MYYQPKQETEHLRTCWVQRIATENAALHAAPRTESGCESPFRFAERRSSAAADRQLSTASNSDSSRLLLLLLLYTSTAFLHLSFSFIFLYPSSFIIIHSSFFNFIATESMRASKRLNLYCEGQSQVSAASLKLHPVRMRINFIKRTEDGPFHGP